MLSRQENDKALQLGLIGALRVVLTNYQLYVVHFISQKWNENETNGRSYHFQLCSRHVPLQPRRTQRQGDFARCQAFVAAEE